MRSARWAMMLAFSDTLFRYLSYGGALFRLAVACKDDGLVYVLKVALETHDGSSFFYVTDACSYRMLEIIKLSTFLLRQNIFKALESLDFH